MQRQHLVGGENGLGLEPFPLRRLVISALVAGAMCVGAAGAVATVGVAGADEADAPVVTRIADFEDRDAGLFPDTENNEKYVNAGNRGCNSCHDDLFDVMNAQVPAHILEYVGYDKKGTIFDCLGCHEHHVAYGGPYFGDIIHTVHMSSGAFNSGGGNCFSCHVVESKGEIGEYQIELFEEQLYTSDLGGWVGSTDDLVRWWNNSRMPGDSDYRTDLSTLSDPDVSVELSQPISDEEDNFIVNNWGEIDVDASEWVLSVTGVNNPRTFTIEELRELPQTEVTATQVCATNGRGGVLVGNIPASGVTINDLVEACGGLVEGANYINVDAGENDQWAQGAPLDMSVDNGSILALDFYGHELTPDEGFPVVWVQPGIPGATWCKFITNISFTQEEDPQLGFSATADGWGDERVADQYPAGYNPTYPVNSSFFQNDGVTFKVGETGTLEGFSFSWSTVEAIGDITKVEFSFDMGQTWTTVDVPADFDPYQWICWSVNWTPEQAGTYTVLVHAVTETGRTHVDNGIIVVVEE